MYWGSILEETNPDVSNSLLEEKIREGIGSEAPMGIIQKRAHYPKWITDNTKSKNG